MKENREQFQKVVISTMKGQPYDGREFDKVWIGKWFDFVQNKIKVLKFISGKILIEYFVFNLKEQNHLGIGLNIPYAGNFFKLFRSYFGMISIRKSKI